MCFELPWVTFTKLLQSYNTSHSNNYLKPTFTSWHFAFYLLFLRVLCIKFIEPSPVLHVGQHSNG